MRIQKISVFLFLSHIAWTTACKDPSASKGSAKQKANGAGNPATGTEDSSYAESGKETEESAEAAEQKDEAAARIAELQLRAEQINEALISKLSKSHGAARDASWSSSQADLSEDWLLALPEAYWDKTLDQVPRDTACAATEVNCDAQFLRKLCSTDTDCADSRTSCLPLAASVSAPGQTPRSMCQHPADKLIDRMYKLIISADENVEFTSLSSPTGRFREGLINAMAYLTHKAQVPTVRLLFAGDSSVSPNILVPAKKALDDLMREVEKRGGQKDKPAVNLGWFSSARLSWNHSKIILADQKRMLQGGHNMWDEDYLGDKPVFDVSMELSGSAAIGAQAYVNLLWKEAGKSGIGIDLGYTTNISTHPGTFNRIPSPQLASYQATGASKVINVGRMGAFGDNAGDDALIGLIEAAQKSLLLSQQDLFSGVSFQLLPSFALDALVDALLRGVQVRIVQSNPGAFLGYGIVDAEPSMQEIIRVAEAQAKSRNMRPAEGLSLRATLCSRLEYATLAFTEGVDKWADGAALANHAKVVIADEASFYIGSQNLYPANLQEFGVIVTDAGRTQQFMDRYWLPLWKASSKRIRKCS